MIDDVLQYFNFAFCDITIYHIYGVLREFFVQYLISLSDNVQESLSGQNNLDHTELS